MYNLTDRLTKTVESQGREVVTCIHYGTPQCRVHSNGTMNCPTCECCFAIYDKLNRLEVLLGEGILKVADENQLKQGR